MAQGSRPFRASQPIAVTSAGLTDVLVAASLAEFAAETAGGERLWRGHLDVRIEVVPCLQPGAVDLRASNQLPGDEVLHCAAAEWAEFVAAIKDGKFDELSPSHGTDA